MQRAAMQTASAGILGRSELISQCNHILSPQGVPSDAMQEGHEK
jgi:hypothetical protein